MQLQALLMLVMAASPFVTFGVMKMREVVVVHRAVQATKLSEQTACNERVADVVAQINATALKHAREAVEAEMAVTPTPSDKPALMALCMSSASCRERQAVKK